MNQAALDKMLTGRAVLLVTQRFWGAMVYGLRLIEDSNIPTACTDGRGLRYNPDYILSLTAPQLRGLLAEEVSHIARLHHTRRQGREPGAWNEACDFGISPDLKAGGFDTSDPNGGMLYDPRFRDMSAEEIYAVRQKEGGKRPGAGKGSARGQITDAPGGEAGKEKAEMEAQAAVRSAYAIAKKHAGAGSLPADILAIVGDLDKGRVDWRRKLRNFAEDSAIKETDWRRPSKRSPWPIILPGKTSSAPSKVCVGLDWSGSTIGDARKAFGGEIQAMLDERAVGEVVVVYHDVDVKKVERYEPGDALKLESHGNGGTAFGPTLAWIGREEPDASCIIFLTDLDGGDNATIRAPGAPVLWCKTPGYGTKPPAFGEIIEIDPYGN